MPRPSHRQRGFTPLEALGVLAILLLIGVLIGILLPALGTARRTSRQMQNNTQLRGTTQGLFIFAQGNKAAGNDGFYPGLDPRGMVAPGSVAGQDGARFTAPPGTPANALALLMAGDFIPAGNAEYFLNPADPDVIMPVPGDHLQPPTPEQPGHYSYAFLDYGGAGAGVGQAPVFPGRAAEWKETVNTRAVVLGDRNTGGDTEVGSRISSVWTDPHSGQWRGGVARNDASVATEPSPVIDGLKYGWVIVDRDHLFEDDPGINARGGVGRDPGGLADKDADVANADAFLHTGPHDADPDGRAGLAAAE